MPKRNRAASLVRYAKIENLGWRRGSVVSSKNGRVKPDAIIYAGKEYRIPATSHYQIRHYSGNKAVHVTIGSDYDAALSTLAKFTASRQLEASQAALGSSSRKLQRRPRRSPSNSKDTSTKRANSTCQRTLSASTGQR